MAGQAVLIIINFTVPVGAHNVNAKHRLITFGQRRRGIRPGYPVGGAGGSLGMS